jgi:hypothetical protein
MEGDETTRRPPAYFGPQTEPETRRRTILDEASWTKTDKNVFGLYKKYWTIEDRPHDPDFYTSPEDMNDVDTNASLSEANLEKDLYPFPNLSSFLLGEWYWSDRNEKSRESFRDLIEILTSDIFDQEELRGANWDRINAVLASSEFDDPLQTSFEWAGDGTSWQTTSIQLDVPFNSTSLLPGPHHYEVPDFHYRPLVPIIIDRLRDASRGDQFHIVPTDLRWQRDDGGPDVRVYGELYNSPAFLNAFKEVQVSDNSLYSSLKTFCCYGYLTNH